MRQSLPLDDFLICPHDDRDGCSCRKPLPGMLLDAQKRYGIDLARSFLVGDRWRDIDAGRAAGCRTVYIDQQLPRARTVFPSRRACGFAPRRGRLDRAQLRTGRLSWRSLI